MSEKIREASILNETALLAEIKTVHKKSRQTYGYLRITEALRRKGLLVNKKKTARLMRENGICGLQNKRFRPKTTLSKHNYPISANLLKRDFKANKLNEIWVSDITYIKVNHKWCYLCTVIDLANREIVGWSFEEHIRTSMVIQAVKPAVKKRGILNKKGQLIFHSDRGSQYASHVFREYLKSIGAKSSMNAKGSCYDNAAAESLFAILKREEVNRKEYKSMNLLPKLPLASLPVRARGRAAMPSVKPSGSLGFTIIILRGAL